MKFQFRRALPTLVVLSAFIVHSVTTAQTEGRTPSNTRARSALLPHAPPQNLPEQKPATVAPKSAISDAELQDLELFSKKDLNEKKDYPQVVKSIKILMALDNEDPSRTNVMMMSESYNKYKKIYDKAFKALETKKNKKQLLEIKQVMADAENGNG